MSDKIQIRAGTASEATTANPALLRDVDGAEFAVTDDRTAGVGNVRGWFGDPDDMTHTAQVAAEARGVWATPGDLDTATALLVPKTTTVNGHALSANVTVSKSDVGLGSVTNDAQLKASDLDTDTALTADSDTKIPSQHAVKTFVAAAVTGLLELKGSTNCSANPNYPAASKGDLYVVTAAGKIGGASGTSVDIADTYFALADNAGGTQASVGTSWAVLEHNLVGALLSGNNLSDLGSASTARTNLGLGDSSTHAASDFALSTRQVSASTGLTGGGNLTADRSLAVDFGSGTNQVRHGDDAAYTDSRTPISHASSHAAAGGDPVTVTEAQVTGLVSDLAGKQPIDADLTTIAGLTATTDNFLVSVASAWASRTPAQVKATLAIAESDVTNLTTDLAAKAPLASPALTGTPTAPDPSTAQGLATKAYHDNNLNTIRVRAASGVLNVNVSTGLEAGDLIDGVTLVAGDFVLLAAQSTPSQNGVYVASSSGAASRSTHTISATTEFNVSEGTANANTKWQVTTSGTIVLGTTALTITILSATRTYVGQLLYGWTPLRNGMTGASYDPALASVSNQGPAGGTLSVVRIETPVAITPNTIYLWVSTAGATLTNVGVGLWDSGGTLLQSRVNSNGATTTAFQSSGLQTITLASAQAVAAGAAFYVGFWFTGTTIPKIASASSLNLMNIGLSTPNLRFAIANTSLTTTAPSSLTAMSNAAASYWAGVA